MADKQDTSYQQHVIVADFPHFRLGPRETPFALLCSHSSVLMGEWSLTRIDKVIRLELTFNSYPIG
jgi:hypothetical protein